METTQVMRYAAYFAPAPGTPFNALGAAWLGRDAHTGECLAQPAQDGLEGLTAEPSRYGFHATLKPPFVLREGIGSEALLRAVAAIAASEAAIELKLKASVLDGFVALVPDGPSPPLAELAARCVRELDGFRRPPSPAELARRRKTPLTPRQEENLERWGYPYVFHDFRFHMTLTERLAPGQGEALAAAAEVHFAPVLAQPIAIDGLTLFQEAGAGDPFIAIRHFPFQAMAREAAE
jgi:putative phosphonate metabolism protein